MNKQELALLEKAYAAEVDAALSKSGLYMMQTMATKRADALVADGLLRKVKETLAGRYTVEGYALTDAGRLAFCLTCEEEAPSTPIRCATCGGATPRSGRLVATGECVCSVGRKRAA